MARVCNVFFATFPRLSSPYMNNSSTFLFRFSVHEPFIQCPRSFRPKFERASSLTVELVVELVSAPGSNACAEVLAPRKCSVLPFRKPAASFPAGFFVPPEIRKRHVTWLQNRPSGMNLLKEKEEESNSFNK